MAPQVLPEIRDRFPALAHLDPRTADGRGETNRIGAMARDFVIRTVNGRLNFRKAYFDVTLHAL